MKIAMLGAGGMGSVIGAKLAAAGNDVYMLDVWKEHVEKMQKEGLVLETAEGQKVLKVSATLNAQDIYDWGGCMDLVVVFVKGPLTEQAIQNARPFIGEKTFVFTVQNGVGHADIIAKYVNPERIIMGTTLCAAVLLGPGHVRDSSPDTYTQIMPKEGPVTEDVLKIAEVLTAAGLNTEVTPEAETAIWRKLCVNCCTCGIGTITRLTCGQVCEKPDGHALVTEIIREVCAVANAKGLKLDYEENLNHFLEVFSTSGHYASMVQDAKRKGPTEIENITGAVVHEGERLGIPTPYNTTIYHLIRMITAHYNDQMF